MASNKNQHYVPRCYLRPFTLDGAGIAISLFNIVRSRFVENASLKSQCSADYFYGSDLVIERALQSPEGGYAIVLSEIAQPLYVLNDEHRAVLRRFMLLQHLRTDAASRRSVESFVQMEAATGSTIDGFRPSMRDAVHMAINAFVESSDILDDLKVCLIRNRTTTPFVTSDDPAVMTNRWYFQDRRTIGESPGLYSSGIIFLFPLSPRVICVAYDGDVYSVPHTAGWAEARSERDIFAFNQHQFLNCGANIYFRDWSQCQCIANGFARVAPLRPNARFKTHYAIPDGIENGAQVYRTVSREKVGKHERALIHTQSVLPRPISWPSQINFRTNGSTNATGTGAGYIRNGALIHHPGLRYQKERI